MDHRRKEVVPSECLVFEDSMVGVQAGFRAGMRVVWVPNSDVRGGYRTRGKEMVAGGTRSGGGDGDDGWLFGEMDDCWIECLGSLEEFEYEKYGIDIPS
jgi:pseudouridine-5'-monophosphatase